MSGSNSVLVLGARGLLGTAVTNVLKENQQHVVAHTTEKFRTRADIVDYLDRVAPDRVVNCIGYKGTLESEHYAINGCLPRAIVDWGVSRGAPVINISTNAVFPPSDDHFWLPTDSPRPSTAYESAKSFGEDPRAYTIRASFIGLSLGAPRGVLDNLLAGLPFWDRKWNGITTLTLARRIAKVVSTSTSVGGIEHVHSPSVSSFSEVAKLVNSRSPCLGFRSDGRLLGGGAVAEKLEYQLEELLLTAAR